MVLHTVTEENSQPESRVSQHSYADSIVGVRKGVGVGCSEAVFGIAGRGPVLSSEANSWQGCLQKESHAETQSRVHGAL